jgi:hypothetical protein
MFVQNLKFDVESIGPSFKHFIFKIFFFQMHGKSKTAVFGEKMIYFFPNGGKPLPPHQSMHTTHKTRSILLSLGASTVLPKAKSLP